jgi:hypothetical protein
LAESGFLAEILGAAPEKVLNVLTSQAGSRGLCGCDSLVEMLQTAENLKDLSEKEKEENSVCWGGKF